MAGLLATHVNQPMPTGEQQIAAAQPENGRDSTEAYNSPMDDHRPMQRRYFDNAATSFPKPPEVAAAVANYLTEIGASPGRGAYAEAVEAGRILGRCRELINRLVHGESSNHVIFTLHTTDALNLAI